VQLDYVLQMYHVGYQKGHRPSSVREPPVESATSITVQYSVDPFKVSASTAAHVATLNKVRTKNFDLGTPTSQHVSAQMAFVLD